MHYLMQLFLTSYTTQTWPLCSASFHLSCFNSFDVFRDTALLSKYEDKQDKWWLSWKRSIWCRVYDIKNIIYIKKCVVCYRDSIIVFSSGLYKILYAVSFLLIKGIFNKSVFSVSVSLKVDCSVSFKVDFCIALTY